MSRTSLAYCAGVVDSDGCITIKRRRIKTAAQWTFCPVVFVRQVERGAVDLLCQTFGGRIRQHAPSTPGGKPLWHWEIGHKGAITAAKRLRPFLRIKHVQADILQEFGRFVGNQRHRVKSFWFKWEKNEKHISVREAAAMKNRPPEIISQAAYNKSIPSRLIRGKRRIPLRFMENYTLLGPGKQNLPVQYTEKRLEFVARIRSLNGPTRGVTTASRNPSAN